MTFIPNQHAELERCGARDMASWSRRFLEADLAAVRFVSRSARSTTGRILAVVISKLGNGWIYLILGAIVFLCAGREALPVVLLAGLNAALLHCLFPHIKRRIGRPRPFHVDPRLPSLLKILDEHSFPSGHTMTLSGVLVPIVIAWPSIAMSAAALVLSMAWSRIATAHHYPSDVVVGAALGVAMAYPLSTLFFAMW
ncbi:MAG: phosphatase PAP2 family protein [Methylocystaceae bacterium]|nr:MAG: phosphatase PAP2 family protein [Methylocystaceae bacterium]